ncbi:helix-turn-helix transcriptional regulator [Paenibacillus hemerocallicola]|jgi:DNA-binding HxlR family transcriptional regulator|uniref:Helix-turn-helix transcriptional regulator n=1 Tax=Paenibacillus hemerocallicola TaxID=1172614 RepID=A0A5C4TGJ3_9BACL|nr:helix-turn-helix domain-containing protein [Paenibacillus hemerocallicola]TNJ67697.1 helix-turn-helix transcriptional regulator [Paenibacillus hemerocallicola]
MKDRYDLPCNIAQTLNIIGDRWTLLIIHEVLIGHTTFNEIKKSLEGISSRLLSERLKYLEEAGLIESRLYSEHPPRYSYTATESGKALENVFHSLVLWGREHLQKCYKKLIHASCGHEVQIAYYCPHCEQNVTDLKVTELASSDLQLQQS